MRFIPKSIAVAALLLAAAVVFSPLIAALTGTGLRATALATAFGGITVLLTGSVKIAIVGAGIALLIGVPFALLVDRSRATLRRAFWTVGLLVLMVPPYVVAEACIVLFGPAGKLSRPLATLIGFGPVAMNPVDIARFSVPGFVFSRTVTGAVMGGCFFPIVALAVSSAYRRTDHRVFEAARISQGKRGVFEIAARILTGPALGAALLVFAATLTEFAVPQLLRVRTVGEAIYERIQEGELASAAALSLSLLPLVVIAGAAGSLILARSRSASMAGLEGEVPKFTGPEGTPLWDFLSAIMTLVAITPGIVVPLISLVSLAVLAKLPEPSAMGTHKLLRASGFVDSFKGAWGLAHDDAIRTVLLAALAATLATVFAIVLVRLVSPIGWGPLLGGLGAGLAVPAPVVGLGLVALWNRESFAFVYQGWGIVLLAWFARFFPIAVFLVQGALARVPRELESAAALAGRRPVERFFQVVLPLAMPGIVAAWLAMYVLCATEFTATLLIAPAGSPMLAPSVVNLMRRGQDPEIAACQVLLLAVVALPLVPIAIAAVCRRRAWTAVKGST